jgi:hypothetical protein
VPAAEGRWRSVEFLFTSSRARLRRAGPPGRPGRACGVAAGPVRSPGAPDRSTPKESRRRPDGMGRGPRGWGSPASETLDSSHGASLEEQGADRAIAGRSKDCPIRWRA